MGGLLRNPVLLVLLCASLVGTPVTYRGGASHPHPHMFLEFLMDAAAGTFDHHHHGDTEQRAGADVGVRHADEHPRTFEKKPDTSPVTGPAERFGASLSPFVVGDVGQIALILPEDVLPHAVRFDTAFRTGMPLLAGITHSPAAPPPR